MALPLRGASVPWFGRDLRRAPRARAAKTRRALRPIAGLLRIRQGTTLGSERSDELYASIPGPDFFECGGPGGGAQVEGGEEGFVHVHSGIHGVGDLEPAERDWRNPVACISITRVSGR